jgi:transcriptional regulator with XRE-family HTH domain
MAEQGELSFAGLLRRLRAEVRLTQGELAEAAGVSYRTVSDLERGLNKTARKDTAGLLAGALGLAGQARVVFIAAARGRASPGEVLAARAAQPPVAGAAAGPVGDPVPAAEAWAGRVVPAAASGWVAPRELPGDVPGFAGREGGAGGAGPAAARGHRRWERPGWGAGGYLRGGRDRGGG